MRRLIIVLPALVIASCAASAAVLFVAPSSGGGSGPSTSWVGIPDPTSTMGYDPINVEEPADPAEWPGGVSTGNYYIDSGHVSCTDSSNTYGYPDQPRCSLPTTVTLVGGNKAVLVGDGETYSPGGTVNISGSGGSSTAGDQIWFVGRSATDISVEANKPVIDEILGSSASYVIIDGIKITGQVTGSGILGVGAFGTIRNSVVQGTGAAITTGNSTAMPLSSNQVFYNVKIYDYGDWETTSSSDYHAVKPGDGVSNTWTLELECFGIQGDCWQVGEASGTAASTQNHYVGGGLMYQTKENAIDVKSAENVVISGVEMHTMGTSPNGDSFVAAVIQDDCANVWFRGNLVRGSLRGLIVQEDCENVYVLDNVFRDFNATSGAGFQDPGSAISVENGTLLNTVVVANNTFHNVRTGAAWVAGQTGSVHVNNLYRDRDETANPEHFDFGDDDDSVTSDYNIYDETLNGRFYNGTYFEPLSNFPTAEANSSEADPLFTNEAGDDFTLGAGSPAIDAGRPTKPPGYAEGLSVIGESFEFDFAGNARPASGTDWDIGAYERQ